MRSIPQVIIDRLGSQGIEPVLVVGIKWGGSKETFYTAKVLGGKFLPYLYSVGNLESVTRVDGGQATQFEVTFDDSTGHFKNFIDASDPHFKVIKVYQYFERAGSSLHLLFEGQIATPITWNYHRALFTCNAITKEPRVEVGFSAEEGQFPEIHEDLIGQPWPIGFGTPIHVPALALQKSPTGTLVNAFGVPDPTLPLQIAKLQQLIGNARNYAEAAAVYGGYAHISGDLETESQWQQISVQAQEEADRLEAELRKIILVQQAMEVYVKRNNFVIGGFKFPQGRSVVIKINEMLFRAKFKGQQGDYLNNAPTNPDQACPVSLTPIYPPVKVTYDPLTGEQILEKQSFTFIQAGSQVTIMDDYPIDYVVNCIPSLIRSVYAYRSFNGRRQLSMVPEDYYTVISGSYNGIAGENNSVNPTILRVKRPFSTIAYYSNLQTTRADDYKNFISNVQSLAVQPHIVNNIDWDDQPYVTFESSVGPNPIDIIQWLVETYTDYTIDASTFADVRAKLEKFPAHFCLFDRKLVNELISDIAYQSRCRAWIKNGKYYIKFLAATPGTPEQNITLADMIEDSCVLEATSTEEIVTKYVASWRPDYAHSEPNKVIIRHNAGLKRYGVQSQDYDYYIFNDRELVKRSATFWMIRSSNSWKNLTFTVGLKKLNLETFDDVTLDWSAIANDPVTAEIQSVSYNPTNLTLQVSMWVPVRFGEMQAYDFAWPADISTTLFYPTYYEVTGGGAGGFNSGTVGTLPKFNEIQVIYQDPKDVDKPAVPNYPIDYGAGFLSDEVAPEFTSRVQATQTLGFQTQPIFDYDFTRSALVEKTPEKSTTRIWPCEILSGSGDTYTVQVYKQGFPGPSTNLEVKQLQIDGSEQIAAGTRWYVIENVTLKGEVSYTMQVPVWLDEP